MLYNFLTPTEEYESAVNGFVPTTSLLTTEN